MGDVLKITRPRTPSTRSRPPGMQTVGMFDERPIELAGFKLRARSVEVVGKPTVEQWSAAFQFASETMGSSPYWIGDMVSYAESRADWREKLEQAKSITGLAEQTLHNLGWVSRHVQEEERQISPSVSHSAEVAPLERTEQKEWLEKSRTEGWTARELREEIRAARRTKVIDGQAELKGQYRVILADPPWLYGDSGATKDGSLGKAARHYKGMPIADICKLPVASHALKDSVLFMWTTAPMLYENPGPREVIEAWGFTPKTQFIWDKVLGNVGHYNHVTHELLIVATRGSCMPDVPTPQPKSVQVERRGQEHSAKPEWARKLIEKHWTRGPYLELFGRRPVEGWSVFGNDARLWAEQRADEARRA